MTTDFAVKVVSIKSVTAHSNADRLDICEIAGWQCVAQRGQYKSGDLAIYVPIDSILPKEIEDTLFGPDAKVKLSKSRVKTIKLRGAISQGMLAKCSLFNIPEKEGYDCTKELGITKFEPPEAPPSMRGGNPVSKKKKNPFFKEYGGLDNFKNYPELFKEGEEVVITEKIHGCLESRTNISFVDGRVLSIQEVVEGKIAGEVWGISEDGNMVPTQIVNWFDNGKTKEWKYLKFTRKKLNKGNSFGKIACTPNHRFFVPTLKEYVRCDQLKIGDKLLVSRSDIEISYVQRSILIGKMLGDGHYSSRAIAFGHKKDHEEYVNETLKSLGVLAGNKQKEQVSGFGTIMVRARTISSFAIEDEFESWFISDSKQVPNGLQLNPISLAYWYMDDGSLSHHEDQEDRAHFAVCGFTEESVNNLVSSLTNLGIKAIPYVADGYNRIRLNADEAEKLFVMISPYITSCMRYKLPERYRNTPFVSLASSNNYKNVLVEQEVLAVEDAEPSQIPNQTRYDIETSSHNFIANGVVVHNSNFRFGWVPTETDTFTKKVKKFFGVLPKYEFVFGSNRVQLQNRVSSSNWKAKMLGWIPIKTIRTIAYQGYYEQGGVGNIYEEAVKNYNLKDLTNNPELMGMVFYGEIYGDGIQKGYTYGCKSGERKLVMFDILDTKEPSTFLDHGVMEDTCKALGLAVVPILYNGPHNIVQAKALTKGNSILVPTQKVIEGVVIRPVTEEKCHMGRKVLKLISDDYLLGDNTDFH